MSWVKIGAQIGATLLGSYLKGKSQAEAVEGATTPQMEALRLQQHRYDEMMTLMAPFIKGGLRSTWAQERLLGLKGEKAQAGEIAKIEGSPAFQARLGAGEKSVMRHAAAMGGIRGGNVKAALAEQSSEMLGQEIERQFGRLGQMTQVGQTSAAGVGVGGLRTGAESAGIYKTIGEIRSGAELGKGAVYQQALGDVADIIGEYYKN